MIFKPLPLLTLFAAPAMAQSEAYFSDAFGMAPYSAIEGTSRVNWAGLQDRVSAQGQTRHRTVAPDDVDQILAFVGPKSAVAGKDEVHAVAVGVDRWGNLMADGQELTIRSGLDAPKRASGRTGIADVIFMPAPRSGQHHLGISLPNVQSARSEYRVVPDLESVALEIGEPRAPFASEAIANVATPVLRDRFGNQVDSGVAVQMRLDHSDGSTSLATALTVDGIAQARFLTRAIVSEALSRITLLRASSEPVGFAVNQLNGVDAPGISGVELRGTGAIRLRIGPFLTDAGYLLNDGAQVDIRYRLTGGVAHELTGWLRDGMFEVVVPGRIENLPMTVTITAQTGTFQKRLTRLEPDSENSTGGLE